MVALFIAFDTLNGLTTAAAIITTFVLRLLAIRYHWRAPLAWNRRSAVAEEP